MANGNNEVANLTNAGDASVTAPNTVEPSANLLADCNSYGRDSSQTVGQQQGCATPRETFPGSFSNGGQGRISPGCLPPLELSNRGDFNCQPPRGVYDGRYSSGSNDRDAHNEKWEQHNRDSQRQRDEENREHARHNDRNDDRNNDRYNDHNRDRDWNRRNKHNDNSYTYADKNVVISASQRNGKGLDIFFGKPPCDDNPRRSDRNNSRDYERQVPPIVRGERPCPPEHNSRRNVPEERVPCQDNQRETTENSAENTRKNDCGQIRSVIFRGANGRQDTVSAYTAEKNESLQQVMKRLHPALSEEQLQKEVKGLIAYNKGYGNQIDGQQITEGQTIYLTSVKFTDEKGQIERIESPNGRVTSFDYDKGKLKSFRVTNPNGPTEEGKRNADGSWLLNKNGATITAREVHVSKAGDVVINVDDSTRLVRLTRGDDVATKFDHNKQPIESLIVRDGKMHALYKYDQNDGTNKFTANYSDQPHRNVFVDTAQAHLGERISRLLGLDSLPQASKNDLAEASPYNDARSEIRSENVYQFNGANVNENTNLTEKYKTRYKSTPVPKMQTQKQREAG
jgi:hypothetical protein